MLRRRDVRLAICLLLLGTGHLCAQEKSSSALSDPPARASATIEVTNDHQGVGSAEHSERMEIESGSANMPQEGAPVSSLTLNPHQRSIREWAVCDGKTDDAHNVAKAFAAAAHYSFTLLVDCPVYIHVGMNISRPIFVDDGTTVQFKGAGLFLLDNSLIPSFAIINSNNINFLGWRVEYVGAESLSSQPGFYCEDPQGTNFTTGQGCAANEQYVAYTGYSSAEFLSLILKPWAAAHRNITYQNSNPEWHNPGNISALFYIIGDTSNMNIDDMRLSVPADAGGYQFMPMIFTMLQGPKNNQTVTAAMQTAASLSTSVYAIPHDLNFSNIDIDGAYMGWQGEARNTTITHIRSHRYGDLQDANGENIGGTPTLSGITEWFPPPHLFYFIYPSTWDTPLHNNNIHISDVIDYGNRVGVARDTSVLNLSGNALSLKIGADNSSVDNYVSYRPDGLTDVLNSNGLTISNVVGFYNSAFLNNLYPGIRFPSAGNYNNVTLENISLTDQAATTQAGPVAPTPSTINVSNITFKNVQVILNNWSGNPLSTPPGAYCCGGTTVNGTGYRNSLLGHYVPGANNNITINYLINGMDTEVIASEHGSNVSLYASHLGIRNYIGKLGAIDHHDLVPSPALNLLNGSDKSAE